MYKLLPPLSPGIILIKLEECMPVWKRVRYNSSLKVFFDSQRRFKRDLTRNLASELAEAGYERPLEGPLCMSIQVTLRLPSYWSKKKKLKKMGAYVSSKPDLDNILKFHLDALQGIVFKDDSQIARLTDCYKQYGEKDKILLRFVTYSDD